MREERNGEESERHGMMVSKKNKRNFTFHFSKFYTSIYPVYDLKFLRKF